MPFSSNVAYSICSIKYALLYKNYKMESVVYRPRTNYTSVLLCAFTSIHRSEPARLAPAAMPSDAAARFLREFSRAVFQQWRAQSAAASSPERFWRSDAALARVLEDAAAKLPRGPLKSQLTRELSTHAAALAALLEELDAENETVETPLESTGQRQLLTEAEVEQAEALDDADALGLGHGELPDDSVEGIQELAARFAAVRARGFESEDQQSRACGALAGQVADAVKQVATLRWLKEAWAVDADASSASRMQTKIVRAELQRLVQLDACWAAAGSSSVLAAPWSAFHRPAPAKGSDYDAEMAKVFAWLVALAVYFPLEAVEDEDEAMATSESEDSSDDEGERTQGQRKAVVSELDVAETAQFAARQTAFAALQRRKTAGDDQWLVRVLTHLASLPKPTAYIREDDSDDDDEGDVGLPADDRRALLDCVADLYARAFATPAALVAGSSELEQDADAVRAVLCARQAALFMRSERRRTIPSVAAATAMLARAPLPSSFVMWLHEVKRQLRSQSEKQAELLNAAKTLLAGREGGNTLLAGALLKDAVSIDMLSTMLKV